MRILDVEHFFYPCFIFGVRTANRGKASIGGDDQSSQNSKTIRLKHFSASQYSENAINPSAAAGSYFVSPKPNDCPVGGSQTPEISLVSSSVCAQLRSPELGQFMLPGW